VKIATALRAEYYDAMWDELAKTCRELGPDSEGFRAQVALVGVLFPVWSEDDIAKKVRSLSGASDLSTEG